LVRADFDGNRKEGAMSRRIAQVWIFGFLLIWAPAVSAQIPYSQDSIPTRTALGRVGLERHWSGVVPLEGAERLIQVSLSGKLLFAQTSSARLHVYDAESGRHYWTANLGSESVHAFPASANSFAVFATNSGTLHALDRNTGRPLWKTDLDFMPSISTTCDEDRVIVGLKSGEFIAFSLKKTDEQGNEKILLAPFKVWNWSTNGPAGTRPLPAERVVILGGGDGKVYVAFSDQRTMIYRIATGGAIGHGFASYGTRTLIIPSADQNLYAFDLLTAKGLWTFSTGSPVRQAPIVIGENVFVINDAGALSNLDPKTGSPRWTTATHSANLIAMGKTKIYLASENRDLYVIDRETGNTLADPASTYQRAGLNLRELDLSFTNRENDRMYFGTKSGLLLCIREIAQPQPLVFRDPKALPFGYVPPEGLPKAEKGDLPAAEFRVGGEANEPATNPVDQ
jgi:outer membrane protein assembly factor BamB